MNVLLRFTYIVCLLSCLAINVKAQTDVTCPGTQASRLVVGGQARVVALDGINLRSLPGVRNPLVNTALFGDLMDVLEGPFCNESLAWWRVAYDGERAWTAEGLSDLYFLAPYILQHAQVGSVEITAQPELVESITARSLDDRIEFQLEGYAVQEGFFPPIVRIFATLPNFDEVPLIQSVLAGDEIDDIALPVQGLSNVALLELPEGEALRYTSLFISPNLPEAPPVLLYSARGITRDGRYISLNLPLRVPNLPRPFQPEGDVAEYVETYVAEQQEILNALPPDFFTPNLDWLDAMVQSITTRALPLPSGDEVPFVYFDSLRFDYTSMLARAVVAEQADATAALPRHIRVRFTGYPVENPQYQAAIRVYSADFIPASRIIGLNLLLEQRPTTPDAISIPLRAADKQRFLAQVTYREMRNGAGVRFLTTYADDVTPDTVIYSFQGVTDDNRFYISAIFPLVIPNWPDTLDAGAISAWLERQPPAVFNPPLDALDAMMASLQMRLPVR